MKFQDVSYDTRNISIKDVYELSNIILWLFVRRIKKKKAFENSKNAEGSKKL